MCHLRKTGGLRAALGGLKAAVAAGTRDMKCYDSVKDKHDLPEAANLHFQNFVSTITGGKPLTQLSTSCVK